MEWTAKAQHRLEALAAEQALSAAQIARELGTTRGAVFSRAFRTGVKLRPKTVDLFGRQSVNGRTKKVVLEQIMKILAEHDVGPGTASYWLKMYSLTPEKLEHYRQRLVNHASTRRRASRESRLAALEAERREVEPTNRPLLDAMSPRHREMMELRVAGTPLSQIAERFGISAARVFQIDVGYRHGGLIVPGAKGVDELPPKGTAIAPLNRGPTRMECFRPVPDALAAVAGEAPAESVAEINQMIDLDRRAGGRLRPLNWDREILMASAAGHSQAEIGRQADMGVAVVGNILKYWSVRRPCAQAA